METLSSAIVLGNRFVDAVALATELHATQTRKGGTVPYLSHLLIVAGTVLENGGDEDEAIAALLHDAAEDQGGRPTLDLIRDRFGDKVAGIVGDCTDSFEDPKPAWRPRKERYVAHLAAAGRSTKRVAGSDKLHNLSRTLANYRAAPDKPAFWSRFNSSGRDQAWYYGECLKAIDGPDAPSLVGEFRRCYGDFVAALEEGGDL